MNPIIIGEGAKSIIPGLTLVLCESSQFKTNWKINVEISILGRKGQIGVEWGKRLVENWQTRC